MYTRRMRTVRSFIDTKGISGHIRRTGKVCSFLYTVILDGPTTYGAGLFVHKQHDSLWTHDVLEGLFVH